MKGAVLITPPLGLMDFVCIYKTNKKVKGKTQMSNSKVP